MGELEVNHEELFSVRLKRLEERLRHVDLSLGDKLLQEQEKRQQKVQK